MTGLLIEIPGTPAPQGSKVRTRFGMREDNPNTRPWRATVASYAKEAVLDVAAPPELRGGALLTGPVAVALELAFPRPKSHYRTGRHAGVVKDTAPLWHAQKPDADKLARAILDGLRDGGVYRDDSQVCALRVLKFWAGKGYARIHVVPAVTDELDVAAVELGFEDWVPRAWEEFA